MTSLVLSYYSYNTKRLETLSSYVSDGLLYSAAFCHAPKLLLASPQTNLYKTECMMRGINLTLTEIEPGQKVKLWGGMRILHLSNQFPDFNDNDEVWVNCPEREVTTL